MTLQERKHICNLATDLLIDAGISSLPIDCNKVAALYTPFWCKSRSLTDFQNLVSLSMRILPIFGLKNFVQNAELLGINLAAPMIVIHMLKITSPDELANLSRVPLAFAKEQFREYQRRFSKKSCVISRPERKLAFQFSDWAAQWAENHRL